MLRMPRSSLYMREGLTTRQGLHLLQACSMPVSQPASIMFLTLYVVTHSLELIICEVNV